MKGILHLLPHGIGIELHTVLAVSGKLDFHGQVNGFAILCNEMSLYERCNPTVNQRAEYFLGHQQEVIPGNSHLLELLIRNFFFCEKISC